MTAFLFEHRAYDLPDRAVVEVDANGVVVVIRNIDRYYRL